MKKQQISGYVMAGTGFAMILWNAVNYVFGLDRASPPLFILGIVFCVIGMGIVRKARK